MRPARNIALLVLAMGACADTGILVEVTSGEDGPSSVHELSVYVGYQNLLDTDYNFRDADPLRNVLLDRDLRSRPYTVLVNPGQVAARDLILVAVSHDEQGRPDGFGVVGPVRFADGSFLKHTVVLDRMPGLFDETETCLRFDAGTGYIEIGLTGDLDCDGYGDDEDCDAQNPFVHPGKTEDCSNGVDDDCDGLVDVPTDRDGDGFTSCDGGDCDDRNAAINPGAEEACNGVDDNCDGSCDSEFDADGDRFTTCGSNIVGDGTCRDAPPDCNDDVEADPALAAKVYPGAPELCDGVDNNCDGRCDEDFDMDGDGFVGLSCPTGGVRVDCTPGPLDCAVGDQMDADDDPLINPGQRELCDNVDNDCNPQTEEPEGESCFATESGDCYGGARDCLPNGGGLGPCVPVVSSDNLVPDEFCDAYDQCAGDVDPFACFEQETNSRLSLLSCRLNFTGEGELCDPRETNLPDNSQVTDQCTWRQVGGTVQHGYLAGLRPIGSTAEVVSRLDQCKAKFAVQDTQTTPPTPAAFVLWEEVNGTGQADDVVVIDLQVQQVADCDSLPPVPMCAGLPTLLPSD